MSCTAFYGYDSTVSGYPRSRGVSTWEPSLWERAGARPGGRSLRDGQADGLRGGQLGLFAQIQDMNPYKADKGMVGIVAAFVCATMGAMTRRL